MGSSDLLDVNIWLAVASSKHTHHQRAQWYWHRQAGSRLVFCTHTMMGVLRLLTLPHLPDAEKHAPQQAMHVLTEWLEHPAISVAREPSGCHDALRSLVAGEHVRPKDWSDAYLAAFAIAGNMRLVTFDRDFNRFPGLQLLILADETI